MLLPVASFAIFNGSPAHVSNYSSVEYPSFDNPKVCVTAEQRIGVGGGILGKMRPCLSKMRPIWAICMKNGQKCSRIGGGGGNSS